jgi:hypothetical protein
MPSLLDLPGCVLVDVLANWISMKDVGRLDAACCQRDLRKKYLAIVGSEYGIFKPEDCSSRFTLGYYRWLKSRNCSVTEFNMPYIIDMPYNPGELSHPLLKCNVPYIVSADVPEIGITEKMAKYLQQITFELFCDNLSDETFIQIVQHAYPALSALTLGADGYCAVLSDDTLRHLGQRAPNLKRLRLVQSPHFTDTGLRDLASTCSKLEDIRLLKTGKLGDGAVDSIAQFCPHLATLHLSHNSRVTGASLKNLLRKCKQLRELDLSNCEVSLPSLRTDDIGSDIGTDTDSRDCAPTRTDTEPLNLQSLVLNSTSTTDAMLASFLPFTRLLTLKLIDTQTVTDVGAASIATLRCLTSLTIDCCYRITPLGLVNIITNSPFLTLLNLHSANMSDAVLEAISLSCRGLEELRITWSKAVTDTGLLALARGCRNLRVLSLNGDTYITHT